MLKVISLGNSLRGDDGIGPHIIENLATRGDQDHYELCDAGSDPFDILEKLLQPEPVLVIDCARICQGKQVSGIYVWIISAWIQSG